MEPNGGSPANRFERIERLLEKMVNSYVHFVEQHGRLLEEHERRTDERVNVLIDLVQGSARSRRVH